MEHSVPSLHFACAINAHYACNFTRIIESRDSLTWDALFARVGTLVMPIPPHAYSLTGTQMQNRFRSPYTLSMRPIGVQYLTCFSVASGNTPSSRE